MGLDIRLPIGLLFLILGALLTGYGLVGDKVIYQQSLGININLVWGVVLLVFGAVMFVMGKRGTAAMRTATDSPEGQAIETAERVTGKERDDNRGTH